jgi:hypothetical protein
MDKDGLISHNVFFSLKDTSLVAQAHLIEASKKYLTGHPGEMSFAVGALAKELNRSVNDRDFDVALHILFRTQTDHDRYQVAPRHLAFIRENEGNWKIVRVFDSVVEQVGLTQQELSSQFV